MKNLFQIIMKEKYKKFIHITNEYLSNYNLLQNVIKIFCYLINRYNLVYKGV